MLNTKIFNTLIVFFLLSSLAQTHAAVNDVFPGDYFTADEGISTFTLYGFSRESAGPYSKGKKLVNGKLEQNILALRYARAFDYKGMTFSPIVVLSWLDARVHPSELAQAIGKETQGSGDLRLGLTAWPIKDRQNAEYLGLSTTLIAPTGSYDSKQALNFGENRWRLVLSGGYQKDITPRLLYELSPEMVFYGDNDNYTGGKKLSQSPSFALTSYLRSRLFKGVHLFGGLQLNYGGETSINGVDQNNPSEHQRLSLGSSIFLPNRQQVILRFSKDIDSRNGFRLNQDFALRYQMSF